MRGNRRLLIAPDLTLLGGFRSTLEKGQLARTNVVPYNIAHSFYLPIAMMAVSLIGWPVLWLRPGLELFLLGLGWAVHISVDRAVGYRFKTWDGRQRTRFTFATTAKRITATTPPPPASTWNAPNDHGVLEIPRRNALSRGTYMETPSLGYSSSDENTSWVGG